MCGFQSIVQKNIYIYYEKNCPYCREVQNVVRMSEKLESFQLEMNQRTKKIAEKKKNEKKSVKSIKSEKNNPDDE